MSHVSAVPRVTSIGVTPISNTRSLIRHRPLANPRRNDRSAALAISTAGGGDRRSGMARSDAVAHCRVTQVDKDIDALRGGEVELLARDRRGEQPAVVADQGKGNRRAGVGAKRKQQRTRIGRIEYPEPVKARRDVEIGAVR